MFAFQKTPDGNGESYSSEVFFMCSKNLISLHKNDVSQHKRKSKKDAIRNEFMHQAIWETLPLGEEGLQTINGLRLGEEPHLLQISGSRLLCFWRTDLGYLDSSYSDDNGRSWTSSKPLSYYPTAHIQSKKFKDNSHKSLLDYSADERKAINNDLIIKRIGEWMQLAGDDFGTCTRRVCGSRLLPDFVHIVQPQKKK